MTREEEINVMRGWVLTDKDREALETVLPEIKENDDKKIKAQIIYAVNQLHICDETKDKCIAWINKQVPPKWLYRLEYKDGTCGLWYNGEGKWCFEQGIGSVEGCKTKDLPMDHDERYKQDGRDWFSSCSRKEDLMHWYSLDDAEKLIKKGFVFTRYLATEYHEYEQETVFIKESSLYREEINIFELFGIGVKKPKFKVGDWITDNTSTFQIVRVENEWYYADDGDKICFDVAHQYYHLWTIQDAKPGDVLKDFSSILIFKKIKDHTIETYCTFYGDDGELVLDDDFGFDNEKTKLATKEQQDLLFQKIKEEGYEWDDKRLAFLKMEKDENLDFAINLLQGIVDRNEGEYSEKVKASIEYIKDLAKGDRSKCLMSALQEANKKIGELVDENYYLKNPKDGIWHDGKEEA